MQVQHEKNDMTEKDDSFLPKKSLFTVFEVSEYFGVTERTVRLWIEHGHLSSVKIVGSTRVPRESIIQCRFKKDENEK